MHSVHSNNRNMLTDIFANRYADRPIWQWIKDSDKKLLVQGFQLVSEELFSLSKDIPPDKTNKNAWYSLHSRLCREFGLESLSPLRWGIEQSRHVQEWGTKTFDVICKTWLLESIKEGQDADVFMKQRISFFELAFRDYKQLIKAAEMSIKSQLDVLNKDSTDSTNKLLALFEPHHKAELARLDMLKIDIDLMGAAFNRACDELNERFRRANVPLHYHNGFIQIESDPLVQAQISEPFWKIISDPKWKNVEIDMAEAVDRSESAQRDPALYAAKALESAIKIISDERGWTTGKERGAGNYIDNLKSTSNGGFIEEWEAKAIQHIFSNVRNGLGHGPGNDPMPELTQQQTDWTIEAAMSWTKSLIGRL